jgi:hypothetical protein
MNDFSIIFELERQLHSSEVRTNPSKIDLLLAPDFYEFGSSGKVWTREETLKSLQAEDGETKIESRDYKAMPLAEDVVLITYVSTRLFEGKVSQEFLRSSIWRKYLGHWKMEFHQGTLKSV